MAAKYDMIVVGTGWHGLSAAKVYIELHPAEEVKLLESADSVGGTWAQHRIYPGLKSNNLLDQYENPDFPMTPEVYGVQPGEHIPGEVLHRYLTDFAKKFGMFSRTQLGVTVDSIEAIDDGYRVNTSTPSGQRALETKKIIVATGLTSEPNFPQYPGKDDFSGAYFHAKDFRGNGETMQTAENVVVVGAGKSAYDVAYAYAEAGAHVDMVVRQNGKGPVYISKPWVMGGKSRLEKLLTVRWMTWFSPCPFGGIDGYQWFRNFLHGTMVGRFIVDKFWEGLGGEVIQTNGYANQPEAKKLQPFDSAFWIASGLSILNFDTDFFDLVKKGRIHVHSADVEKLSKDKVHLTDGTELDADVLVCATGWKKDPPMRFVNFGDAGIGLPQSKEEQARLAKQADEKLLKLYPRLQKQPATSPEKSGDPFRLYRFMIPPTRISNRNIAFAGLVSSTYTTIAANVQALWISAFMDGRLDKMASTTDEITEEVMLHTQWGKWRYPFGYGATLPDLAFDSQPYVDLLVNDLGLAVKRKPGMFAALTQPHGPEDYAGLIDEWVDKHPAKQ